MARLPQPGSDEGTWGNVLNDFLSQSLTSSGALKSDAIGSAQIQDGSIADAKVALNAAISADKLADGSTNKVYTAAEKNKLAGLATVASSGSYADLSNRPSLPADRPVSLSGRVAFFGDSITGYQYKYPSIVQALSLGRIQVAGLYSHSGFSSGQLVPLVTDFTQATSKPDKVVILCGTNDIQGTLDGPAFKSNIMAIIGAATSSQIEPILCTIPPLGSQFTSAKRGQVATANAQLRLLASSLNVQVIDFHAVLTDASTGQWLSGMDSGDGVHPAYAGQLAMAQAATTLLQALSPAGGLPLCQSNTDTANIFTNPLAITDANSDGVADGWDAWNGSTTGLAFSLATDVAVRGKWATVTHTSSSAQAQIQNRRVGGFNAGDTVYFACLAKTSGLNSAAGFDIYVTWWLDYGGTVVRQDRIGAGGPVGSGPGLYAGTFTAPATATQVSVQLVMPASTGVYQIGQVTGYNLTQLGIS